jgi:hypothetical protein
MGSALATDRRRLGLAGRSACPAATPVDAGKVQTGSRVDGFAWPLLVLVASRPCVAAVALCRRSRAPAPAAA